MDLYLVIMGYQKISEKTEERMREFITKSLEGRPAKRGRKNGYMHLQVYTFDEALSMLLTEVGF